MTRHYATTHHWRRVAISHSGVNPEPGDAGLAVTIFEMKQSRITLCRVKHQVLIIEDLDRNERPLRVTDSSVEEVKGYALREIDPGRNGSMARRISDGRNGLDTKPLAPAERARSAPSGSP